MTNEQILEISTEVGLRLLENGAEIYRVEESVTRILNAYGIEIADAFAVPTCLIVTIVRCDGHTETRMKRIMNRSTNLDMVSALNHLCRTICKEKPDYNQAKEQIEALKNRKVYIKWVQILAFGLVAFSFTIFYGGNWVDAIVSAFGSIIMKVLLIAMEKFKTNTFFAYTVGSMEIALVAFLFMRFGIVQNADKVIIGGVMNLVPGVALTNSMRDITAGDLLAGIAKFVEAIMIGIAIAAGTGIGVYLLKIVL